MNAVNKQGRTPLYLAVLYTQPALVKQLLQARADPNIVPQHEEAGTIRKQSLLHLARRKEEIQNLLRRAGAR